MRCDAISRAMQLDFSSDISSATNTERRGDFHVKKIKWDCLPSKRHRVRQQEETHRTLQWKENSNNMAIAIHRLLLFFSVDFALGWLLSKRSEQHLHLDCNLLQMDVRTEKWSEKIARLIESHYFTWWDALKWSLSAFVFFGQSETDGTDLFGCHGETLTFVVSLSHGMTHPFSRWQSKRERRNSAVISLLWSKVTIDDKHWEPLEIRLHWMRRLCPSLRIFIFPQNSDLPIWFIVTCSIRLKSNDLSQ